MTVESDILIRNGTLVDGSGNTSFKADLEICGGRISHIGQEVSTESRAIIDAKGQVICPGFIDIHSHSDGSIPFDNRIESMIRQGVTTSVIGNCGSSLAPINEDTLDVIQKELDIFSPAGHNLNITWRSFDEYLNTVEKTRIPINVVPLVGFGTIRIAAGPSFENREPTKREFARMKAYVKEAMIAGAFGLSTGLYYPPQSYASTSEIIKLAKTVANYNGLYFSHIRGEGKTVVQSIKELIKIVEESGCRGGQIAHHKISGRPYWGTSKKTLKLIADANKRGTRITCDQYPYNRGMTSLVSLLPPWVHEGGMESLLSSLITSETQQRIKSDIAAGVKGWENVVKEIGWDRIYIASVKTEKWMSIQGKSLEQIANELEYNDVFLLLFQLLLDEAAEVSMTIESMDEQDIQRIMTDKHTMIGSDGWGISPTGIFSQSKPHPRSYGTFPRILGKYVREEKVLTLEDAIWKMTGFPAKTLNLKDRGHLQEGFWADIVVFNPKTIRDRATFTNPHQFPVGIRNVIVNGEIVVDKTSQLDVFPGKVLRGNAYSAH